MFFFLKNVSCIHKETLNITEALSMCKHITYEPYSLRIHSIAIERIAKSERTKTGEGGCDRSKTIRVVFTLALNHDLYTVIRSLWFLLSLCHCLSLCRSRYLSSSFSKFSPLSKHIFGLCLSIISFAFSHVAFIIPECVHCNCMYTVWWNFKCSCCVWMSKWIYVACATVGTASYIACDFAAIVSLTSVIFHCLSMLSFYFPICLFALLLQDT